MKAWVLHENGDIRLDETDRPKPAKGEVLLRVRAAGICGSDIPRTFRNGAYFYPLIIGHEFAGEVAEVGEDVPSELCGKRVGVFPLIPCEECAPCRNRQYEMCRSYSYLGSRRDGGFAEYAAVPAKNLILLPEGVSFEAAAMLEPMAVAVHAIRRTSLRDSDTIVVHGTGTIGMMIVMFLQERGASNLLCVGNKDFQRQTVERLGISDGNFCNSKQTDPEKWIQEKTEGRGADVIFECVGKNETIAQAVNSAAAGGRIVLVGNPACDITLEKSVYWKILRNQLTVTGTWNSSFTGSSGDDWHYVIERLGAGLISPERFITHRLTIEELEKGLRIMLDKSEDYIKIMTIL